MLRIKQFLINERDSVKSVYFWNMIASLLNAFQSVIMIIILSRFVGLIETGIFTIAYANANLFLTIGKYGMRNYQVSDVKRKYAFQEYKLSRLITTSIMIIVSFAYVVFMAKTNDYSMTKIGIMIWMTLFKVVDSVEDVYHAYYHQNNRLDIASKAMALRMMITIVLFAVCLIVTGSLYYSLIISTIITAGIAMLFVRWSKTAVNQSEERKAISSNVGSLLKSCFPLFLSAFLSFYIGNAPKYAIDSMLNDEIQACYGFISMPVFVIGLLNNFIFNPMLYQLSNLWNQKKVKEFVFKVFRQMLIVGAITLVCIVGAYLIGVPVLSIMYNTNLAPYKVELIILLIGGGFLGLTGLLNTVITIMRFQKNTLWGYIFVGAGALFLSNSVVAQYGIRGASVLYTGLMGILSVIFIILFVIGILKTSQSDNH